MPTSPGEVDPFMGCAWESERTYSVLTKIEGLYINLTASRGNLQGIDYLHRLFKDLEQLYLLLRDLGTTPQLHYTRVLPTANNLNILLPCLQKTLRDITRYVDNTTESTEMRWRRMYHEMKRECDDADLGHRFKTYKDYVNMLQHLLSNSPSFDPNALITLKDRVLAFRAARGIKLPLHVVKGPFLPVEAMATVASPNKQGITHWGQTIFSGNRLSSTTPLKSHGRSEVFDAGRPKEYFTMPSYTQKLPKIMLDKGRVGITFCLDERSQTCHVLIQTFRHNSPVYTVRGTHELCIAREKSSVFLKRWSRKDDKSKLWADLVFQTWEDLVLFYCGFLSLKARNLSTVALDPGEYNFDGEKRLFQAQIEDDDFEHSLMIYEDKKTKGLRLHAAVWSGELRLCPIWTAFITHQSASPSWIELRGSRRVWLRDIQLYVFCDIYNEQRQRKGKAGAFEICFKREQARASFVDCLLPEPSVVAGPSTAVG